MCGTIWNCNEDGGGVEGPREKTLSLVMGSMDAIAQSVEEERARGGVKEERVGEIGEREERARCLASVPQTTR